MTDKQNTTSAKKMNFMMSGVSVEKTKADLLRTIKHGKTVNNKGMLNLKERLLKRPMEIFMPFFLNEGVTGGLIPNGRFYFPHKT